MLNVLMLIIIRSYQVIVPNNQHGRYILDPIRNNQYDQEDSTYKDFE